MKRLFGKYWRHEAKREGGSLRNKHTRINNFFLTQLQTMTRWEQTPVAVWK